ncbi:MAG: branched-chain amino acid transport system permease protein [Solirubrobacteraceae bacterium]|jgi:branched-chain amino acid transport system permease protein|nr:branched-chain amino acid transport system permease protein [Solirubrobacteraceae bacterium]
MSADDAAPVSPLKGTSPLQNPWVRRGLTALAILAAFVIPQFFDTGSIWMDRLTYCMAYVIMALGLNVVVGFAGLLDLGYVAFFALGAYSIGWLGSGFFDPAGAQSDNPPFIRLNLHIGVNPIQETLPGVHLNFLLILVAAGIIAALFGAILGFPTLRLRGDYIAIVTLAFGEIIGRTAINGDDIAGRNFTNGKIGINPIDAPDLPGFDQFTTLSLRPWYYLALVLVLIIVYINIRLRDSRLGRAWIAVREDEVAAVSMGIPTVKVKLLAYSLGAAMGGVSGAFLGAYIQQINADQFMFSFSIFILAMVILGGIGSIPGVIVGAISLTLINKWLIPDVFGNAPQKVGLDFDLSQLGFGIFGFLLVIMMVLRPQGLIPERRRAMELTEAEDSVFEATV